MSRNPYHVDRSEPTLRQSVFAFMDILGYRDVVSRCSTNQSQQQTLRALHHALTQGRNWLEDKEDPEALKVLGKMDFYALKAFTDNIVIAWPVRGNAEVEIGDAFFRIGAFQFQMVLEGFFIRGAISVGDAYVDDIAVFGDALIEAHEGESTLARDPRVILTRSAVDAVKQHLTYYPNRHNAPHVRDVLRDSDGQWFLNYLECVLWAEDDQGPFYEEFGRHKGAIETKLSEHKGNPPIWAKYAWVANYHNFFCELHPHHFTDEHKVDVKLFSQPLGLIVDEG